MLEHVRTPLCSRVAPVAPRAASSPAAARVAVADAVERYAAVPGVMLADSHAVDRERVQGHEL